MANEQWQSPLRPDHRLYLEAFLEGLTYAFAGIAALNLDTQPAVVATLILGALMSMVRRLLGKSYTTEVARSNNEVKAQIATNSVLQTAASPKILATAVEAGVAVRTNTVQPPPAVVVP